MFNRIKRWYHKRRYNKLLDEQYKREKEMRERALNFQLEEVERRLERTEATLNHFHSVFKENN